MHRFNRSVALKKLLHLRLIVLPLSPMMIFFNRVFRPEQVFCHASAIVSA
jgi:hypothetical protein